jgi:hypothetical protein
MSCTGNLTACKQLKEAEAAYHNLMTGTAIVEITDQNGDRVKFGSANRANLYSYIQDLRLLCPDTVATAQPKVSGPAGFIF